ncbi:MAG: dihydroorotase [Phycisphaerales bacterium]
MGTLLIRRGRVIDPASGHDGVADVAVADGAIAAIGPGLPTSPAGRVIDAEGLLVVPGLIDPHVHLREPGQEHKENLETGGRAAAFGGFTTVCCMPNTSPALDTPELVRFIEQRAREAAACRVFAVAAATKGRRGEELAEIALIARAGAAGFSDDGDCIASAGIMARVLAAVAPTGLAFMQHCQEPTLTRGASMHAGEVSTRLGLTGWPRAAEEVIIERDIRLNRAAGCRYHIQHISSGESVEIVRRARAAGQPVTAEASPHHLLLTHEACEGYTTAAKMNPPLREAADARALREGIADGTITVLATDHAPHTADEKALPFEEAPFGIIGLQTALPLYAEALIESGAIGWPRLIALMTVDPARLCNLDRRGLGQLKAGGPADITVIDPSARWTIRAADLPGRSKNTPFEGRAVKGRAVATIVGGKVQFETGR